MFTRTDADEYRWIDVGPDGRTGSTWISGACAERLGGATRRGNWRELVALAPAIDAIADPCAGSGSAPGSPRAADRSAGFVFARTDSSELRWIDLAPDGRAGSTWISGACAERLGGATRRGNWRELVALAPATDAIESPC